MPLPKNQPYLAIELAVVLTLGGSTVLPADAEKVARHYVAGVLGDAGIKGSVLATAFGLMAPQIPIIGQTNGRDS